MSTARPAGAREVARLVEEAHRTCWPVVLAATVRLTRDLDLAEDCAQDAFVQALRTWPDGPPDSPAAWLSTVARRVALDRLRRETTLRRKLPLLVEEPAGSDDPGRRRRSPRPASRTGSRPTPSCRPAWTPC